MRAIQRLTKIISGDAARKGPGLAPEVMQEFRLATGLRPIEEASPNDVFVAGYPKSGNTWMQYLLAGAFCGVDLRIAPDALIQDLVPDVHFKKFFKPWFPVTFFKTHFLPRPEYRKVVYLLRDGRDAMVSYWHYLEGLAGAKPDFLKMVEEGSGLFPCKWHEHVAQWQVNPHGAQMIIVRYEELKKDPLPQLRRIAALAGISCQDSALQSAVAHSTFGAMKQREAAFAWENPQIPANKQFIRRGQVGSHNDEMPAEVRDAFLTQAGPMLKSMGYLK